MIRNIMPEELDENENRIIWGEYTRDEAHDILKWINRIKAAQMCLIKRLDSIDTWSAKRICDASWYELEHEKNREADREQNADFEKQFLQELLSGGYHEEEDGNADD